MKKIIIRLGEQAPAQCAWARIEADGAVSWAQGSLSEAAGAGIEGYRLLVLIPGADVLLTRVNLPPGNRKQLLAAVPYALEESLASDIEAQHFAIGKADKDGGLAVAVIDRQRLEYWREMCRANGLEPAAIIPETLALPLGDKERTLLLDDGQALMRSGEQEGFALESLSLDVLSSMPDFKEEGTLVLYHAGEKPELPEEVATLIGESRRIDQPMALFAQGLVEKEAINLLQGVYSPQALWERHWHRWRAPAALLLALLLLDTAVGIRENNRLRRYARDLGAGIEEVYRQSAPGNQRVVNPRAQMEQRLKELRAKGPGKIAGLNFLRLMDLGGPVLAATENTRLRGLRYRAGELGLDLEVSDLQSLDALKARLGEQGLMAEVQAAATKGERVEARLQLKENK